MKYEKSCNRTAVLGADIMISAANFSLSDE